MSRERFVRKLSEQLQFLENSSILFDSGIEDEGYRIATALRVIFHDTSHSKSLSRHLKMKQFDI